MLIIRSEQMDSLNAHMRERFIKETVAFVRDIFPEQTDQMQTGEMRRFVQEGIEKAARYNILSERDVTLFIALMMGLGVEFDSQEENSRIHGILSSPELDQQEKINLVYALLERRS
jgi:hypothetical protein